MSDHLLALLTELFLLIYDNHFEFFFPLHLLSINVLNLQSYLSKCLLLILDCLKPELKVTMLHLEPLLDISVCLVAHSRLDLPELAKEPVIASLHEELSEADFATARARCLVLCVFDDHLLWEPTKCVNTILAGSQAAKLAPFP